MSVAFDSAAEMALTPGSGTSIPNFNIVIGSNSNRAVAVGVGWSADPGTTTITVGGITATLVTGTDGTAFSYKTAIYVAIGVSTGTQAVAVSWTNAAYGYAFAVAVYNCDQTTPMNGGANTAIGSDTSVSQSCTSTSGDLTFSNVNNISGATPSGLTSPAGGSTGIKCGPAENSNQIGYGGAIGSGTGTETHTWTAGSPNSLGLSVANFVAATGGGGDTSIWTAFSL